jgi:hypothetical protein
LASLNAVENDFVSCSGKLDAMGHEYLLFACLVTGPTLTSELHTLTFELQYNKCTMEYTAPWRPHSVYTTCILQLSCISENTLYAWESAQRREQRKAESFGSWPNIRTSIDQLFLE